MVVTLDGPAGAGKSTVARTLARRLGFEFLDTGAMYRAVALAAIQRSVDWNNAERLLEVARGIRVELQGDRVLLNGEDVTLAIRQLVVTNNIHHVADNPAIRQRLVEIQRQVAQGRNIITEGRDQGTVAFPQAEVKIFLTATPRERARRRQRELASRGEHLELETVLQQQNDRDQRDATRPVGRLFKADDAIEILTDNLDTDQVVDQIEAIVQARRGRLARN